MNPDKQIVLAAQRSNLTWFVRNVFATVNPGEITNTPGTSMPSRIT